VFGSIVGLLSAIAEDVELVAVVVGAAAAVAVAAAAAAVVVVAVQCAECFVVVGPVHFVVAQ